MLFGLSHTAARGATSQPLFVGSGELSDVLHETWFASVQNVIHFAKCLCRRWLKSWILSKKKVSWRSQLIGIWCQN